MRRIGGKYLTYLSSYDDQRKFYCVDHFVNIWLDTFLFADLMKKLTSMFDGDVILKYQVLSEDLDALVSVKSDEDLRHMLDEIDRYERAGSRLRAFLFSRNPVVMENPYGPPEHHSSKQRYIDSINGIVLPSPLRIKQHPVISNMQCSSRASSGCSSPRSPDSYTGEAMNGEFLVQSSQPKSGLGMHRVRSSPSISSFGNIQQSSNHHVLHPQYYNSSKQPHQMVGYQSLKPPLDSHRTAVPERLFSTRSVGRAEGLQYQVDSVPQQYQYALRQNQGTGWCYKWMPNDDFGQFRDQRPRSHAGSPNSVSPSYSHSGSAGMKAWEMQAE